MSTISYEVQTLFYSTNHQPGVPFTLYFEAEADAHEFIDAVSELPHSCTTLRERPDLNRNLPLPGYWVPKDFTNA